MTVKQARKIAEEFEQKQLPTEEDEFLFTEAMRFLIEEEQNPRDMMWLGGHYYAQQDFDLALKYYEMAKTYDHDEAYECLGYIWYYGRTGEKDYKKAYECFSRLMEKGDPVADVAKKKTQRHDSETDTAMKKAQSTESKQLLSTSQSGVVALVDSREIGDVLKPLIKEIHLFDSYIAGTAHLKEPEVLKTIKTGDMLNLKREENKFDDKAILVLNEAGKKLGYVPEKDNVVFARLMDAGKLLKAKVTGVDHKEGFLMIRIGIYLVDF